jgi:hypothetical protein
MAGPWLFSIAEGYGRTFDITGGAVPVTVETYRQLIVTGRIVEDRWWRISQNWNRIETEDEVFIYTGDGDLGIIGFARVRSIRRRRSGWVIEPDFDLPRSRLLLENPIRAAVVRSWHCNMRRNPVNLEAVSSEFHSLLPWSPSPALPEEVREGTTYCEGSVDRIPVNRYERDPLARRSCIEFYGTACAVCGMSFGVTYGCEVEGLIHVHHLRPLSTVGPIIGSIRLRTCGRFARIAMQ